MKYKPNWDDSRARWTALWHGRHLGRPCITVTAPSGKAVSVPQAANPEEYWLGPKYLAQAAIARMENTYWGGEAIPSILLMGGWVICYGAIPHFEWHTIIDTNAGSPEEAEELLRSAERWCRARV
jgi:hypothetical protein